MSDTSRTLHEAQKVHITRLRDTGSVANIAAVTSITAAAATAAAPARDVSAREITLQRQLGPSLAHHGTSPLRVAFTTLGCKLNQYESDAIAAEFKAAGYEVGDFQQNADIQIVNTCTVTDRADRKSRNAINRARRLLTPLQIAGTENTSIKNEETESIGDLIEHSSSLPNGARLVVMTGCYVEAARDKLESDGRTIVVPNEQKSGIFSIVDAIVRGEMEHPASTEGVSRVFSYKATDTSFHARGTVKIQDGCDNFCTFCIIPYVRGRANSRPLPEILENVRQIVNNGVHEVVLSGVNMSRYRWAESGTGALEIERRFADVVRAILELPHDFRLRISSIEPDQLGPDFIELFKHPKMCPQLHLCLQSGSDRVLLAMRRQYNVAEYRALASALRAINPDFALSTDIIVGFPGETAADFEASLSAAREFGFSQIHVFPYSVRSGTRAERMPGKLNHAEIDARANQLKVLAAELKRKRRSAAIGTTDLMIVERVELDSAKRTVVLSGTGKYFFPLRAELSTGEIECLLPAGTNDPKQLRSSAVLVMGLSLYEGDEPIMRVALENLSTQ